MMNEELRNMLMLAAKAAGIDVVRSRLNDPMCRDFLVKNSRRNESQESGPWNPRDDDGDSFRLACDVGLNVYPLARTMDGGACSAVGTPSDGRLSEVADASLDTRAATRLAILRAAAEIGKAMP